MKKRKYIPSSSDVEETKKLYLMSLDIKKGKKDELERLRRFFLDKEEQTLKDLEVLRKEIQMKKKLAIMYRELVEEAKKRR